MTHARQNWAGHITFSAARYPHPTTVDELQQLIAHSPAVKVVGAGHSFNALADTTGDLFRLDGLPPVFALDATAQTVTVSGAMTYGEVGQRLHAAGYALHNVASLPHITVAGAISTATHGSGDRLGNLATAVEGVTLVTGTGDLLRLTRATCPHFDGVVVSLGALGAIVEVTLRVQPTYAVRQSVYTNLPLPELLTDFDGIMGRATSVSLFTDWHPDRVNQVWLKEAVPAEGSLPPLPTIWRGATLATVPLHPAGDAGAERCTPQLGQIGPWQERLFHFRVDQPPSSGHELQSEYFVARRHAPAAIAALVAHHAAFRPHLRISEVRTVAADTLWLSPAFERPTVGLHFTWHKDWPAVSALLPVIEEALAPFAPRAHWGKLSTLPAAQVVTAYPRAVEFGTLRQTYDPQGKFRNALLDGWWGA